MHLHTHWRTRLSGIFILLLLSACASTPKPADLVAPRSTATVRPAPRTPSPVASAPVTLPPATTNRGGYYLDDGPADVLPENLLAIPDPEPKIETYSPRANRPYTIFGKTYTPVIDNKPFKQRGLGTWYGKKFHMQKTASGELYDMFKMTAAHPTLPIPSYARVTNIANGAQVIVRINDRGPFHSSRVIDLSYTAALKLGYINSGSAMLEVERLLPEDIAAMAARPTVAATLASATRALASALSPRAPEPDLIAAVIDSASAAQAQNGGAIYLQFGAYPEAAVAAAVRSRLRSNWANGKPAFEIVEYGATYRLYSGPYATRDEALAAAAQTHQAGVLTPEIVLR